MGAYMEVLNFEHARKVGASWYKVGICWRRVVFSGEKGLDRLRIQRNLHSMAQLFRHFIQGMGCAVCLFPSREQAPPKVGDYFANVGEHLRRGIVIEAPKIRSKATQLELGLEPQTTTRG